MPFIGSFCSVRLERKRRTSFRSNTNVAGVNVGYGNACWTMIRPHLPQFWCDRTLRLINEEQTSVLRSQPKRQFQIACSVLLSTCLLRPCKDGRGVPNARRAHADRCALVSFSRKAGQREGPSVSASLLTCVLAVLVF